VKIVHGKCMIIIKVLFFDRVLVDDSLGKACGIYRKNVCGSMKGCYYRYYQPYNFCSETYSGKEECDLDTECL
jgi:hypothetical protein